MSNLIQNDKRVNNSISSDKTLGVLEILEKIRQNGNGTVSYVFITKRTRFDMNEDGVDYEHKCVINQPINKKVFLSSEKSNKVYNKKLTEVLEVFKDTCWDKGASYFILS